MNRFCLWVSFLFATVPLHGNAAIYKCTGSGASVVYQDKPCVNGYASELVVPDYRPEYRSGYRPETETAETTEPPSRSLFLNSRLALGMFDTQVLNLRGWGRPAKITRARLKRAWHEEWTYPSATDGERQLQFVNGRLAAITSSSGTLVLATD
ncbi:MAG: hypothetical protein JWN94_2860 [Betaproteobacteria bacterium]|nr:hypothetical protein [Betaproteobacteria bacterium]